MNMSPDDYWSIDFLGVDAEKASAIVEQVVESGLATSANSADPDAFLTLHLDADTALALDSALAASSPRGDTTRVIDSLREAISHWMSTRGTHR
jgi:hypothetical protein